MYLAGVSFRHIEDVTEALWGSKVSPGTISNLNKKAYESTSKSDACVPFQENIPTFMWMASI